jgi:hypothetical protein
MSAFEPDASLVVVLDRLLRYVEPHDIDRLHSIPLTLIA